MVATYKATPNLQFHNKFFLVCKYEVHKSISPCWLLHHLWSGRLWPVHSRNPLDCYCPAALPLQKIVGWWKPSMRTRTCECEACLKKASAASSWWGVSITHTITSPMLICLLILTHKLSADSSPIPRQSSMHFSCSLTYKANHLPHLWPALPKHFVSIHGSTQLCELSCYVSVIPSFHVVWPGTWRQTVQGVMRVWKTGWGDSSGGLKASDIKKGQREGWARLSLKTPIENKLQEAILSDIRKTISPCEC